MTLPRGVGKRIERAFSSYLFACATTYWSCKLAGISFSPFLPLLAFLPVLVYELYLVFLFYQGKEEPVFMEEEE